MRHVFVSPETLRDPEIALTGPDHHHLARVLRLRPGERLVLLDGAGRALCAEVVTVGPRDITLRAAGDADAAPEPAVHVTVYQAIGKGDRFDDVLQHATEAGASVFVPLLTERGVVRVDPKDAGSRRERWERIVRGAAEQSHRAIMPRVEPPCTLADAVARTDPSALALPLDPTGQPMARLLPAPCAGLAMPACAAVLVGPEGGFAPAELDLLRAAGREPVSLGAHILRTETAAVVAVSRILHHADLLAL